MYRYNLIIRGFNRTIRRLEGLAAGNNKAIDRNKAKIEVREEANTLLGAEALAASNTARKLRNLIDA